MNQSNTQPFDLLRKKQKLILLVALIFGIGSLLYAFSKKTQYVAITSFSLEDAKSSSNSGLLGLASQFGFDLGGNVGGVFTGDNIMELFKTRRIVEAVLLREIGTTHKLLVDELYFDLLKKGDEINSSRFKGFSFRKSHDNKQFQFWQDSLLGGLFTLVSENYVVVEKPDKKLNIIVISCKTPNENFSKTLCDDLVDEVSKFYIDTKVGRARKNVEILQNKADSLRRVYSGKLSGRASISDANINPLFQTSQVGIIEKQTDISVVLTAYTEVIKNLEMSKFALLRETPLIQVIDYPKFPLKKKKPNMILYSLAGFLAGGILTISIIIFLFVYRVYFKNDQQS